MLATVAWCKRLFLSTAQCQHGGFKSGTHPYPEETSSGGSFVCSLLTMAHPTYLMQIKCSTNFSISVSAFPSSCIKPNCCLTTEGLKEKWCVCFAYLSNNRCKKATRNKMCAFILLLKPQHIHMHTTLVEPWPSTADIHHDMLPSLVCPFARLMCWSTTMNYTW